MDRRCELCQHFRPRRNLTEIFRLPHGLGVAQTLQQVMQMEQDLAAREKETRINERHSIQFGAYFFNVFNHPDFYLGDQTVTSATFGRIDSQNYSNENIGPRSLQFGLYYRF